MNLINMTFQKQVRLGFVSVIVSVCVNTCYHFMSRDAAFPRGY